jgi:hypothetical protein
MTQPTLLLNGVDRQPETQGPARRTEHIQKANSRERLPVYLGVAPSSELLLTPRGVAKSNAHFILLEGGHIELCEEQVTCLSDRNKQGSLQQVSQGVKVSMTCNISKYVSPSIEVVAATSVPLGRPT